MLVQPSSSYGSSTSSVWIEVEKMRHKAKIKIMEDKKSFLASFNKAMNVLLL
jgi:hypothetical protein